MMRMKNMSKNNHGMSPILETAEKLWKIILARKRKLILKKKTDWFMRLKPAERSYGSDIWDAKRQNCGMKRRISPE